MVLSNLVSKHFFKIDQRVIPNAMAILVEALNVSRKVLLVGLGVVGFLGFALPDSYGAKPFMVYDATLYTGKPNLSTFGVRPIHIAYEPHLFDERVRAKRPVNAMPTDSRIEIQANQSRKIESDYIIIDIEAWSVNNSLRYGTEVASSIRKFKKVISQFRSVAPDQKLGLFGALPVVSGYERIGMTKDPVKHSEMQHDNSVLAPLFEIVDAVFPMAYTFTNRPEEWRASIELQVSEARRVRPGVPIFLFLWPRYADYGPIEAKLKSRPLERDYWRYQLETAYDLVDGLVVWGGWGSNNKREKWDEEAIWWQELKAFLSEKQLSSASGQ